MKEFIELSNGENYEALVNLDKVLHIIKGSNDKIVIIPDGTKMISQTPTIIIEYDNGKNFTISFKDDAGRDNLYKQLRGLALKPDSPKFNFNN